MNTHNPGLPDYTGPNEGLALWVHHGQMLEFCTDFAGRIAYILREKPAHEHAVRLAALTYLPDAELPPALSQAWTAYVQARTAYVQARTAYVQACTAYDQAWTAYVQACTALNQACTAYNPDILALCEQYCHGLYDATGLRFESLCAETIEQPANGGRP